MRATSLLTFWFLVTASLQAQTTSDTFDVASVKVSAAPMGRGGPGGGPGGRGGRGVSGGPGTSDPARIRFQSATLKSLLIYAYGVQAYQVSGPAFLDTERYDIEGRIAPDTSKHQVTVMLQNLLADRFKLKLHHSTKDLPMYSILIAKAGPKLKVSAAVEPQEQQQENTPPSGPPQMPGRGAMTFDSDGFPIFPGGGMPGGPGRGGRGGLGMMMAPGNRARIMGTQSTVADLAAQLSDMLSRPVTDATGLTPKYDITLTFSTEGLNITMGGRGGPGGPGGGGPGGGPDGPEGMQPQGDPPPDLFTAIQSQLGLRLEAKKGPVDLLVIDHAERAPTEN
jgi:uncharacterized protein (TIGR03435 family)